MKPLKKLRQRHGFTQSELAEMVGTTQQSIARWETGKSEPSLKSLRDLAIILNTSVDHLMGRKSILEDQSTNPFAWVTGDKTGYWGNVGIRLSKHKHSKWYPVTTSTMEKLFMSLQLIGTDSFYSFQTLNNKMVVFRPLNIQAFTFLDEAEDQVTGDWEVGPDDVEGWPQEVYECLEHILYGLIGEPEAGGFSDNLIKLTNELIADHKLDDREIMKKCVLSKLVYTDGTERFSHVSANRMADLLLDIDLDLSVAELNMLHLDDEDGDHSVFVPATMVDLIEFPLLTLKTGLEAQIADH